MEVTPNLGGRGTLGGSGRGGDGVGNRANCEGRGGMGTVEKRWTTSAVRMYRSSIGMGVGRGTSRGEGTSTSSHDASHTCEEEEGRCAGWKCGLIVDGVGPVDDVAGPGREGRGISYAQSSKPYRSIVVEASYMRGRCKKRSVGVEVGKEARSANVHCDVYDSLLP
jgi:hypothetical protein